MIVSSEFPVLFLAGEWNRKESGPIVSQLRGQRGPCGNFPGEIRKGLVVPTPIVYLRTSIIVIVIIIM